MSTIFLTHRKPALERAIKALLVALVVIAGGCTWQQLAAERIAQRAEQARVAALRMTPAKLQALEREAAIAAAAQAYAQQYQAEREVQARRAADALARPNAQLTPRDAKADPARRG